MIQTIIFDLDGTLVNSVDDIANSCNFALREAGYETHPIEAYKYFVGDGVVKLIERALPQDIEKGQAQDKVLKLYTEHYKKHCFDQTKPYDGIIELLEKLKEKNFKLGVVSNKPNDQVIQVMGKLFDKDYFDLITGVKEGFAPKPDPALTKDLIEKFKVKGENCAFVGDTAMDMLTGISVGACPIGVTWGFRTYEELISNGAKHIINAPLELLTLLSD